MLHGRILTFGLVATFALAFPALAAEKVRPSALRVELITTPTPSATEGDGAAQTQKPGQKPDKQALDQQVAWKKACPVLANAFMVRKNFNHHGIAKGFSCFFDGKHTGGAKSAKGDWTLKIQLKEDRWLLGLYFRDQAEPEAELPFPNVPKALTALADRKVAKPLAMQMMDQLPAARYIEPKELKKELEYKLRKKEMTPAAPAVYDLFDLEYVSSIGMWVPRPLGKATLKKKKGPRRWDVTLNADADTSEGFWAQSDKGRGGESDKYKSSLNGALKKYGMDGDMFDSAKDALLDTFARGYVGFRYGYPITKGENLITKSSMVGILAEVRGGPLEGLRWYWDFAPETKEVVNGQEYSFTWSRPTLGWSFGLNMNWFINRIDLTPKIGLMDFDGKVRVTTATGDVPAQFRLKNSSNFGIEMGVESIAPWFLLRLWGASDVSGVLDLGGSGTVTSLRGGVDTYWDFYKVSDYFDLTVLVFMFGEKLSLTQDESETVANTNLKLEGISYNLAFFGAGLILTW